MKKLCWKAEMNYYEKILKIVASLKSFDDEEKF